MNGSMRRYLVLIANGTYRLAFVAAIAMAAAGFVLSFVYRRLRARG